MFLTKKSNSKKLFIVKITCKIILQSIIVIKNISTLKFKKITLKHEIQLTNVPFKILSASNIVKKSK